MTSLSATTLSFFSSFFYLLCLSDWVVSLFFQGHNSRVVVFVYVFLVGGGGVLFFFFYLFILSFCFFVKCHRVFWKNIKAGRRKRDHTTENVLVADKKKWLETERERIGLK